MEPVYLSYTRETSPAILYNILISLIFVVPIGVFVLTFLLLINRKIKYLKYISKQVEEIANEGLGTMIYIRGNDEIARLCLNINAMSKELKDKFDNERELEKTKYELISGISHDLRTPLTSIKGYLQLLKDKEYQTPEQLENFIDVAFSKTEVLENWINDLFEYTRLSEQETKLEYQRLCLNDIVNQVVMDYGPLFQKENLYLQVFIPNEKYYVQIDPDKYVRVIQNLLENALKYSPKPGNIWVGLNSDNQGVKMTVQNQALNINAESLSHLFDRFYRLEKSRSKETGGAGLGLAIAKSIVELHSGKIWAESKNGTIFLNVWLPLY
jgi:signal transduction histidine kinase